MMRWVGALPAHMVGALGGAGVGVAYVRIWEDQYYYR
jgi:hypothetical protein